MQTPQPLVTYEERVNRNKHQGAVIWFTGLPRSGKSTLAYGLERYLFNQGYNVMVMDGDIVRSGICSDLKYTDEDRTENIRRVSEIAKMLSDNGTIVLASFITPKHTDRDFARKTITNYYEVYCKADIRDCEKRDYKALYSLAKMGKIGNFTGVNSKYEAPIYPELVVDTVNTSIPDSIMSVANMLFDRKIIN